MAEYIYNDYVKNLSKRFVANLDAIIAGHSFEYGPEFEMAICETLRSALPDRFGIARGFVADANNNTAGDDIIVFERTRFPTLALRNKEDYGRKEFIPIEATYCYIEAKHTLHLEGDDDQSFVHASEQVSKVKELCATREAFPPDEITPGVRLTGSGVNVSSPSGYPNIRNPPYGAVFARQVKRKRGKPILTDPQEIKEILISTELSASKEPPDFIVLGENNLVVPVLRGDEAQGQRLLHSPFFLSECSSYAVLIAQGVAFGVALALMMEALDWIQLGAMQWRRILIDGMRDELVDP